ncbi:hypothetical protein ACE6H2_020060 [Prunus campanulata]
MNSHPFFSPPSQPQSSDEGRSLAAAGRISTSGHTKSCGRGHWRPAEYSKLKELVAQYGLQNWILIAEYLNPAEDSKLKELVAQYGPQNWNLIAEHLDGRGT